VDVIIVGGKFGPWSTSHQFEAEKKLLSYTGGAAGCVVAGKLAEADPNLSIFVIEGRQDNYANPSVVHPVCFSII
jgi:alcohol oxidase